jgi:peptidoglycan/LPS O-acetylase OafA/YrhL
MLETPAKSELTAKIKGKSKTFTALNGLRFIAAMAVVVFHFAPDVRGYENVPGVVQKLISEGPAAVAFFFILSGFVLANKYLMSEAGRVNSLPEFYNSRFARLYPAYLVAFLMFAPFAVAKYLGHSAAGGPDWRTFLFAAILNGLMVQAWTSYSQSWNGPSWSLSVEAFMYLVFPFASERIEKLRDTARTLLIVAAWLIPAGITAAFTLGMIQKPLWDSYIRNNPLLWTPLFLIGIAGIRFVEPWSKVAKTTASWLTLAACAGFLALAASWPKDWLEVFITGGVAPLFLLGIILFTRNTNWLTNLVGGKAFDAMGQASYIIYIVQAPTWHYWQAFTNVLRHVPARTQIVELWQFLVFLPLLVIFSMAIEKIVEIPARRFLLGMRKKKTPRAAGTAVAPSSPQ